MTVQAQPANGPGIELEMCACSQLRMTYLWQTRLSQKPASALHWQGVECGLPITCTPFCHGQLLCSNPFRSKVLQVIDPWASCSQRLLSCRSTVNDTHSHLPEVLLLYGEHVPLNACKLPFAGFELL